MTQCESNGFSHTTHNTLKRKKKIKHTRKKNIKLKDLLDVYNDLLIELDTKKKRFNAEYKECQKWRKLGSGFFGLKCKSYSLFNNNIYNMRNGYEVLERAIKNIRDDIIKIHKEWIHVHSISQVSFRSRHGLLHTLPPKKLNMIESVYPTIRDEMALSKQKIAKVVSKPVIPKKVRFNSFVFMKA